MKHIDKDLADLRRDYLIKPLRRLDLDEDPFGQFDTWFNDALSAEAMDANAMMVATVDHSGQPTARPALLKSYSRDGFVFYTNLESHKALDISGNERVALLFYWHELHRQVRINGTASRTPADVDDRYFRRRPRESQVSAWASPQSRAVASRDELEAAVTECANRFADKDITLPPFWGGYCVDPHLIEFWQGRENRLHDRFQFRLNEAGSWQIERLGP